MIRASSFVVALTAAANECAVEYAKQGPCDIDAHELGLPCAWRDGKCKDLKWQHATSRAPIRCGIRAGNMKFIALHWRTQRRNASSPCGAAWLPVAVGLPSRTLLNCWMPRIKCWSIGLSGSNRS